MSACAHAADDRASVWPDRSVAEERVAGRAGGSFRGNGSGTTALPEAGQSMLAASATRHRIDAAAPDIDRPCAWLHAALVDPGDFDAPNDEAWARRLLEIRCRVRLRLESGRRPTEPTGDKDRHLYPLANGRLDQVSPESLFSLGKRPEDGPCLAATAGTLEREGIDVVHVRWAPLTLRDRKLVDRLARRVTVAVTVGDLRLYRGARGGPIVGGPERFLRVVDAPILHTEVAPARSRAAGRVPERVHHVPVGLVDLGTSASPRQIRSDRPLEALLIGAIKPCEGSDIRLAGPARFSTADGPDSVLRSPVGRSEVSPRSVRPSSARASPKKCSCLRTTRRMSRSLRR